MSKNFYDNKKRYNEIKSNNIKNKLNTTVSRKLDIALSLLKLLIEQTSTSTGSSLVNFQPKKIYYIDDPVLFPSILYDKNLKKVLLLVKLWGLIINEYSRYSSELKDLKSAILNDSDLYYVKNAKIRINNSLIKLNSLIDKIKTYK